MKTSSALLKRWHSTLITLTCAALGIFLCVIPPALCMAMSQVSEKVFEEPVKIPRGPDPVELIEIKAAGKTVRIGEKFNAGEDWLKGATFVFQNNSGKEVVHIELYLRFPETGSGRGDMSFFSIVMGNRRGKENTKPLSWKPGEKLSLVFEDARYAEMVKFLASRNHHISIVNKVELYLEIVIFDDDIGWSNGRYLRRAEKDSWRFIPIDSRRPNN